MPASLPCSCSARRPSSLRLAWPREPRPTCWKAKGASGYGYKDSVGAADGVRKISVAGGASGKGKLQVQAGNKAKKGQTALPTGLTAVLAGETSARLQLRTSDAACFEAVLGNVVKSDATQFKAKAP